jgi:glycosyltransferase involved in cell wall biosynthesis
MPEKKKFFVVTTIPLSFIFFKGLLTHLKKEFDVHIVSSPGEKLEEAQKFDNVIAHKIPMAREISLFKDFKALFTFVVLFLKEKPTIVHGNTPKGSFLSMIAAKITRRPIRIYFLHGLRYEGTSGFKRKLLIFMEKITCFCATDIYAVSNGVKKTANKELTNKNITVIGNGSPNGINLTHFNPDLFSAQEERTKISIHQDDFVFGFVGRFVGDKGINELVKSFVEITKTFPKVKLLLVGVFENELDPLEYQTISEIENNPLIINVGFQKDVRPFLMCIDLFVFPSYREGFGLTLIEANAMKIPVISSEITGCDEIVEEGKNGFLVPPKNIDKLKEKMLFCLSNKSIIQSMKNQCREIVSEKFDQVIVWENTLKSYIELIKK